MALQQKKPVSIFDVINENINTTNENVLALIDKVASMEQEVIALRLMFNVPVPEKPDVPGEEGAVHGVNREQAKLS